MPIPSDSDNIGDTFSVVVLQKTDDEIQAHVKKWTKNGVIEAFSWGENLEDAFSHCLGEIDSQDK